MRILVVDDDYLMRVRLKRMLARLGDCDAAPDATIALSLFQAAHAERVPYDLVTMDIDMPGTHGPEAVRSIRLWESQQKVYKRGSEVKILMITGTRGAPDVVQSFHNGCEGYLGKPVTEESLRKALNSIGLECEAVLSPA